MINPQLLEYVRAQRSAGLSKEAIVQALAQGGWTAQDVTEAFMAIDGVQKPPPPPSPPPPANPGPVAPRVIVPPVQPVVTAPPPVQTTPVQRPVPAASEFSTAPSAVKRGHGLLYTLLILLVLIIGAGAALMYFYPTLIGDMLGWTTPTPIVQEYIPPPQNTPIQIMPTLDDASSTASTTTIGTTTSQ